MSPTSPLVVFGLLAMATGLLVVLARMRVLAVKMLAGALALVLAMMTGLVIVNDYYGYYRTWGDVVKDFQGAGPIVGAQNHRLDAGKTFLTRGRIQRLTLDGKLSGIARTGFVYLPPQYDDPKFKSVRFPVIELLHGYPGTPQGWITSLHVTDAVDRLIATHRMGPVIMVMPTIYEGGPQECLDSTRFKDDTYISSDVPADIRATFRVSTEPAEWGLLGLSSGGYCAVNLALRHPALFGSSAAMDGYFRAEPQLLDYNPALVEANSPIDVAGRLPRNTSPLPSIWLSAGSGDAADLAQARAFVAAMVHVEGVQLLVQKGARHDFYAWLQAAPLAIAWSWQQLAPPALKVRFPSLDPGATVLLPGALAAAPKQRPSHVTTVQPPKRSPRPSSTPSQSASHQSLSSPPSSPPTSPPTSSGSSPNVQ